MNPRKPWPSWIAIGLCALLVAPLAAQTVSATRHQRKELKHETQPVEQVQMQMATGLRPHQILTVKAFDRGRLQLPVEESLAEPEGPNPQASLRLADVFEDEALVYELSEICGWDHDLILQDRAAGHVFYYLPREFLLSRGDSGYGLGVQYNSRAEPGQPSVTLNAELEAPRRSGDVALLKAILRQALGLAANAPLEVHSLPGLGASVDLESLTTGLALPPERVHVIPPSHLHKPLRLTLSLTQDEAEAVFSQIEHEGLAGFVSVPIEDQTIRIDFRIQYRRFAGSQVGGFDSWLAGEPLERLENRTDFPLQVNSIHALRTSRGQLERVSKKLNAGSPIPPGGSRAFGLAPAADLLGGDTLVAWLGVELDTDCVDCLRAIKDRVGRGTALAPATPIAFEAIPSVFGQLGLYKIQVRVRSPYFVAGSQTLEERLIELTESANRQQLQLFLPDSDEQDALLLQFQLRVIKETGEVVSDQGWREGRQLSQILGSFQIEPLLEGPAEGS